MSRCKMNRWTAYSAANSTANSACERPVNTEAAKELQARMAAMTKARESQDKMWDSSDTGLNRNSQTTVDNGASKDPKVVNLDHLKT